MSEQKYIPLWTLRYSPRYSTKDHPFTSQHMLVNLPVSHTSARKMVNEIFYQKASSSSYMRFATKAIKSKRKHETDEDEPTTKCQRCDEKDKDVSLFMQTFGFLANLKENKTSKGILKNIGTKENVTVQTKVNVPRKSRKSIKLCETILKNAKRRFYRHLINVYCPLQLPNDLSDDIIARKSTQDLCEENGKFLKMNSCKYNVFLFLRAVTRKILPTYETWGTLKNENIFLKHVRRMINLRMHDKITADEMLKDISMSQLPWLSGDQSTEMLQNFVTWFITDVLFIIIRHFFYVTEHASFRNRLLFYRKEVWRKIVLNGTTILTNNEIWGCNSICNDKQVTCFKCRFCPKSSSIRPIIHLPVSKYTHQENFKTKTILRIFQCICKKYPRMTGCATQGVSGIYFKWKQFVKKTTKSQDLPLYFVKVDADQCYDRIPVCKLMEVLDTNLSRAGNVVISHLISKHRKVGDCVEQILYFLQKSLSNVFISCFGKKYPKLQGIPQGWCLSTMLCDLLYGDLENKYFPSHVQGSAMELLVRFADDFLFVSPNKKIALEFLRIMHAGFPEYGCFINPKKSQTNFEIPAQYFEYCEEISVLSQSSSFPWFGMYFPGHILCSTKKAGKKKVSNLYGVSLDLSRYAAIGSIRDCITVGSSIPTCLISTMLIRNMRLRLLPICLDLEINSKYRILRNVYEVAILIASQWLAHDLHRFPRKRLALRRTQAIFGIEKLAKAAFSAIRKRTTDHRFPSAQCVYWIFYKAFKLKLMRRMSLYKSIVHHLNNAMKQLLKTRHGSTKRLLNHSTAIFPEELRNISMH